MKPTNRRSVGAALIGLIVGITCIALGVGLSESFLVVTAVILVARITKDLM